ncbi:MAG: sugar ABC transporter permease [Chloroflexi bacterium]|nr:sugar ABC transporter permease [Chloroflexota bacterium]
MAVAAQTRVRPRSRTAQRAITGYLFLLPALVLMALFTFYPFAQGLTLSFQEWDGVGRNTPFVGLANYQRVLADTIFWVSMGNAAIFGVVGFVLGNILSLGMAVAVNNVRRGATFYRVAYYLPGVFSVVVVGMMFAWILQGSIGILNRGLAAVGLEWLQNRWLTDPGTALPSVALVYVWYHWGFGFLLFLAGLQGVARELYEAASIDGAGAWARFRYITVPQLMPVTTIVSVLTLLGALQIFGTVQVLTNGGPGYLTEVPTLRIYKEGFQFHRFGVAAAMSVVFGAILMSLALLQIWIGRRADGEAE